MSSEQSNDTFPPATPMSDYPWSQIQRALFAAGWRHSTKRIADGRRDLDGAPLGEDATEHTWAREDERLTAYYVPMNAETDGYLTFWPESLSEVSASIHVEMATPEMVGARLADFGAIRPAWTLPPEPGLEVTRVLDKFGQHFEREDAQDGGAWVGTTFRDEPDVPDLVLEWSILMAYHSPLTDATPAVDDRRTT